jgi:hypothetical protein
MYANVYNLYINKVLFVCPNQVVKIMKSIKVFKIIKNKTHFFLSLIYFEIGFRMFRTLFCRHVSKHLPAVAGYVHPGWSVKLTHTIYV